MQIPNTIPLPSSNQSMKCKVRISFFFKHETWKGEKGKIKTHFFTNLTKPSKKCY